MSELTVARIERYDECATVTLKNGAHEIVVFSHPCNLSEGQSVPNLLHAMVDDVIAAYLLDWPDRIKEERSTMRLERVGEYSYTGCGEVIDFSRGIISVNGFNIVLGIVPFDGPVEFSLSRIDILA